MFSIHKVLSHWCINLYWFSRCNHVWIHKFWKCNLNKSQKLRFVIPDSFLSNSGQAFITDFIPFLYLCRDFKRCHKMLLIWLLYYTHTEKTLDWSPFRSLPLTHYPAILLYFIHASLTICHCSSPRRLCLCLLGCPFVTKTSWHITSSSGSRGWPCAVWSLTRPNTSTSVWSIRLLWGREGVKQEDEEENGEINVQGGEMTVGSCSGRCANASYVTHDALNMDRREEWKSKPGESRSKHRRLSVRRHK